ncbi:condensation domain-containing protein [Streptomyces sp. NPDC088256]|uniref:condensation domain-containing protein n=1 Tax=Streptomyces sp. NPDC088256 TaxID=3365848 RepID=UPI0037FC2438
MTGMPPDDERVLAARAANREPEFISWPGPAQFAAPLSSAQRAMARAERTGSGGVTHFLLAYRLRGRVDYDLLGRAVTELHRRHGIMRTVFPLIGEGDGPRGEWQVVLAPERVCIERRSFVGEADPPRSARSYALRLAEEKYAPRSRPPIRWRFLELAENDGILLLCLHHMLADAESVRVIEEELATLYRALVDCTDIATALPPVPVQYTDFARWEQEQAAAGRYDRHLAHWRRALDDYPRKLALPFDRVPGRGASFRGATLSEEIPTTLMPEVRALARAERASDFMLFLAAYAVLVGELTGQDRIVLGTPVSGRDRPELNRAVGLYADIVPLPLDLSGEPSFRAVLGRVRDCVLDALTHQGAPLELIVKELAWQAPLGRPALVQSVCYLHAAPPPDTQPWPHGLHVEREQLFTPVSSLDLSLAVETDGDTARCLWEYRSGLFNGTTIRRLQARYLALLAGAVQTPDTVTHTGDLH